MKRLPRFFIKLLPFVVVVGLILLTSGTGVVSEKVHTDLLGQLKNSLALMTPVLTSVAEAFLVLYSAFLLYRPVKCTVLRCFDSAGNALSPRGRNLWTLVFQAVFWMTAIVVACRIVAPSFVDSAVFSGGIVMGAVAIAAQDAVKNIIASVCLHTMPKCQEGDYIKVVGSEGAEGIIVKIDYLCASINVKGESKRLIVLPNSVVWNNSVVVGRPDKEEKKKEEPKLVVVVRCNGKADDANCCANGGDAATCGCTVEAVTTPVASDTAGDAKNVDPRGPRSAQADAGTTASVDPTTTTGTGQRSAQADAQSKP